MAARSDLDADGKASAEAEEADERERERKERILLKYVQVVQPQIMEQFSARAPSEVVDAMKQTISNMLGTLPAKHFDVTISTVGENLAQLMLKVMLMGYMFRNAQYRMDVTQTLALPPPRVDDEAEEEADGEYAEGSQQINISGEVLRWHNENGPEKLDAMEYIAMLEREVNKLREQVSYQEKENEAKNYLLEYLQNLEPANLKDMAESTGEEALEAMNAFIERLVGPEYDSEEIKGMQSTSTSVEMARLLYWLLIVGYSLRTIEVRMEIESVVDDDQPGGQQGEQEQDQDPGEGEEEGEEGKSSAGGGGRSTGNGADAGTDGSDGFNHDR